MGIGQTPINIPFLKVSIGHGETTPTKILLSEISVNSEGEIKATYGLDNIEEVGQIQLADFVNEHGLKNIGNAKFQETKKVEHLLLVCQKKNYWKNSSRFFRKI